MFWIVKQVILMVRLLANLQRIQPVWLTASAPPFIEEFRKPLLKSYRGRAFTLSMLSSSLTCSRETEMLSERAKRYIHHSFRKTAPLENVKPLVWELRFTY